VIGFAGSGEKKEKLFKDTNGAFYQRYLTYTSLGCPGVPSRILFCIDGRLSYWKRRDLIVVSPGIICRHSSLGQKIPHHKPRLGGVSLIEVDMSFTGKHNVIRIDKC